jgi:hypothetical protein
LADFFFDGALIDRAHLVSRRKKSKKKSKRQRRASLAVFFCALLRFCGLECARQPELFGGALVFEDQEKTRPCAQNVHARHTSQSASLFFRHFFDPWSSAKTTRQRVHANDSGL